MRSALGTLFFLTMKKGDGSAQASFFHSHWRVNSANGASERGGSREGKCKGCPPAERADTLLSPDQRGGDTGRHPTARFFFVVPCASASLRVSARRAHNKRNICIQSTIWLCRKISRSSCRCSSFVVRATAHARGAQAAAQRQRGIKQRLKEKMNWHYTVPWSVKTAIEITKYEKNVSFFLCNAGWLNRSFARVTHKTHF